MESATARRSSDGGPGRSTESPAPPPQRRGRASNSGVTVTARPSTRNRPEYMAGASIVAVAISSPPPQLRQLPSDIAGQAARAGERNGRRQSPSGRTLPSRSPAPLAVAEDRKSTRLNSSH